jgi:hypothetical protein
VRPARTDDETGVDRLGGVPPVHELGQDAVAVQVQLRHRGPALDRTAERLEVGLQDSLGLILRQAALESTAAVDALESRVANLAQVRSVQANVPDVLGRLKERRKYIDGIQDLKGTRLDRRGTRLSVPLDLFLDKPHSYAVAGEFAGNKQAGRAGADNQDVTLRQEIRILFDPAEVLKA